MKVKSTTNYSMFSYLDGNRKVRDGHVKALMRSIEKRNLLEANPIMVSTKMEVIDGQHRLEAAKRLGVTVYYSVVGDVGIDTVMDLQVAKKWTVRDVIDRWCAAGNNDYIILRDFCDYYGVSPALAKSLLSDVSYKSGTNQGLIDGRFKVTKLEQAKKFADKYVEVRKLIGKKFADTREFILAFQEISKSENYSQAQMLNKLSHSAHTLELRDSRAEYMHDLENLYNRFERQAVTRLF